MSIFKRVGPWVLLATLAGAGLTARQAPADALKLLGAFSGLALYVDTQIEEPPENNNARTLPEQKPGDTVRIQLFAPAAAGGTTNGYTVALDLPGRTFSDYVGSLSGMDWRGNLLIGAPGGAKVSALFVSAATVPATGYLGQVDLTLTRALTTGAALSVKSLVMTSGGDVDSLDASNAVISFTRASCPGDFDNDGMVNLSDFLAFASAFGASSGDATYNTLVDMDGSGGIDLSDFLAFAAVFGSECEPAPPGGGGGSGSAPTDREALVALYNATDGQNWKNRTNWLSDRPLSEWYGVTTDGIGRVTRLTLFRNQLAGTIPEELGALNNLVALGLSGNRLTGTIHPTLGSLTNLQELELDSNQLTGTIPDKLGDLTKLQWLFLFSNRLTGTIPPSLGNLTNLQSLALSSNQLTGTIPPALGNLTNLRVLSLSRNQLTGAIPSAMGGLNNLEELRLNSNPALSGPLPGSFTRLDSLTQLYLDGTGLCAPADAAFQQWLRGIGDKRGVVNCAPGPATSDREALVALYNATDGQNWINRTNWLSDRPLGEWYGVTTDASGWVTNLDLRKNGLTGPIPAELSSLTNLQRLNLYQNQLTGAIPSVLGGLAKLKTLTLRENQLTGTIPAELGSLTSLQYLYLSYNQLSGAVPSWLDTLTNLEGLELAGNRLTGAIPSTLGKLSNLEWLELSANQLKGTIPAELGSLTNLQYLYLYNNAALSGPLPGSFTGLANLQRLYLDGTGLCAPADAAFQQWLRGIGDKRGVVNCGATTTDYDVDDDGLIEVSNLAQLDAIRYDLDGDGTPDAGVSIDNYDNAFPNAADYMGCPGNDGCEGYELIADLDFDTNGNGDADAGDAYWNGGAGWLPIGHGRRGFGFTTTFDGGRHTIANLYINRSISYGNDVGLFGWAGEGSIINRVVLALVEIIAGADGMRGGVGGLVGTNHSSITNCDVQGEVAGYDDVGILVGQNTGTIAGSSANGSVSGGVAVGGLVGSNHGPISYSFAVASVSGKSSSGGLTGWNGAQITDSHATVIIDAVGDGHVGGLIGRNGRGSVTTGSYATGKVTSSGESSDVGGLVGFNNGSISDSYSTVNVNGKGNGGGLVGFNLDTISNSYSTGSVNGDGNFGGLVGENRGGTTVSSYWDTQTSGQSTSAGGVGKTTRELQSPTSNTGIYAAWDNDVWDFGTSSEYPALKNLPDFSPAEQR